MAMRWSPTVMQPPDDMASAALVTRFMTILLRWTADPLMVKSSGKNSGFKPDSPVMGYHFSELRAVLVILNDPTPGS
jgi:hypothetical protein